ncbi:MAG TPA: OmpA family protein [Polyangiaceae bacterium]|nr:OmpA family protein [Polyangiaceae bacterium]
MRDGESKPVPGRVERESPAWVAPLAPGVPGQSSHWTSSRKTAVGTAREEVSQARAPRPPRTRAWKTRFRSALLLSCAALSGCSLRPVSPPLHDEPVGLTWAAPGMEPPATPSAGASAAAETGLPAGRSSSDALAATSTARTGREPASGRPSSSARGGLCNFSSSPPKRIFFATDETTLHARGMQILEDLLACDQAGLLADGQVLLTGFADPRGGAQENQALALARARAVKRYLVRRGMGEGRIRTLSEGATEHQGRSPEGWAYDRRVEVRLAPGTTGRSQASALPDRRLVGH